MSALGAPVLAGLLPPHGALVGIAALVALALLDRIPRRAYQPHPDDDPHGHDPRHQPRLRRRAPTVTLTRLDQPPAPPPGQAIQPRPPTPPAIAPHQPRKGR